MTTQTTRNACQGDLDFAATFLLKNDAGIQGAEWKDYPPDVVKALDDERTSAMGAHSPAACAELLNRFLTSIRPGHLAAISLVPDNSVSVTPGSAPGVASRRLSARTAYIEVRSFGPGVREQLVDLVEKNQDGVLDAANLVIDVRRNGGGNDSAFEPLLSLLGPATYRTHFPDVFVTAANITAWEALLPELTHPPDAEWLTQLVARMKAKGQGWAPTSDKPVVEAVLGESQIKATPERVALLIGQGCGSACEQFVLAARQNPRVTLMGRNTRGNLDASNLRRVLAPSGQIAIYYATTFVRRPGGQQIDGMGIEPDVKLRTPSDEGAFAAEVGIAQRYVEQSAKAYEAQQAAPASVPR